MYFYMCRLLTGMSRLNKNFVFCILYFVFVFCILYFVFVFVFVYVSINCGVGMIVMNECLTCTNNVGYIGYISLLYVV